MKEHEEAHARALMVQAHLSTSSPLRLLATMSNMNSRPDQSACGIEMWFCWQPRTCGLPSLQVCSALLREASLIDRYACNRQPTVYRTF